MLLSQKILEDLIVRLSRLPGAETRTERDDSWMTATEIAAWIKKAHSEDIAPDLIDRDLRLWWQESPSERLLRPAKYPGASTLERLWGHVDVVHRLRHQELQAMRLDQPVELEVLRTPLDAPLYFLAYAAPDLHFAARVRFSLAGRGVRAWLYSGEIDKGDLIFEGVQAAIKRSRCTLALLTPLSLASAWMQTEVGISKSMHQVICVFDGNDKDLMLLLSTWHPPGTFDNSVLSNLQERYAKFYSAARVEKYVSSVSILLSCMAELTKYVYPRRPQGLIFDPSIDDFENMPVFAKKS
jgi:TIR domain